MKQSKPITNDDKTLLSKRGLIETVKDQLKNLHHIEHSRHRSLFNFNGEYDGCCRCILLEPK